MNLLEAARGGCYKFIFASSAAPLGEQTPPLDEQKVPRPLSPYGASKLAGEAYCSAYRGSFGLNTVVLRFSNLYGPFSWHKGSVIATYLKNILNNQPLVIYGDGEQTRDYLYVSDIAKVIRFMIADTTGISGIFQLGTGVETSINHLLVKIRKITGNNFKTLFLPERKGEIERNFTAIRKIVAVMGSRPAFDLTRGLQKTWEWFKNSYDSDTK
jgi:UDP-glucose 4-epimerase